MTDFEKWYDQDGIKRLRGFSDGEMVTMCGIMNTAWKAATARAAKIADNAYASNLVGAADAGRTIAQQIRNEGT